MKEKTCVKTLQRDLVTLEQQLASVGFDPARFEQVRQQIKLIGKRSGPVQRLNKRPAEFVGLAEAKASDC